MRTYKSKKTTASWRSCRLKDFCEKRTAKNVDKKYNSVLTNSAIYGVIKQEEYFEKEVANDENTGTYYIVNPKDFIYNPRISENAPYGPIRANETGEAGIVSPLYFVFGISDSTGVDYDFLKYYFTSSNWHQYIYSIGNNGARCDRMNIADADFMNMTINLPLLAEQKRIAEILGCCDRVIALKKELIAEKKRQKKALMQKLLNPDSGFRLPGFTGEWKLVSIADVADLLTGYPFESEKFSSTGIKLLRCSNVKRGVLDWDPLITVYWRRDDRLKKFQLKSGDIVIAMDGALAGYSFAKITSEDLPLLLVQRVARLRATKICQDYLAHCVINIAFGEYITRVKTDTAIPHMSAKDILNYTFYMPISNDEQQAIAEILSAAEKEIDLLEQELAQQLQKKKSLMQLLLTGIVRG